MKIYLAAQYSWRDKLKEYARILERKNIEVVSAWLKETKDVKEELTTYTNAYAKDHAQMDLDDIQEADILVLFTISPTDVSKRGARHFEAGYAYALGKKVIICGPKENIFYYIGDILQYDDFEDVVDYLVYKHPVW